MPRAYPATPIPPEYEDQRGSFVSGLSAGCYNQSRLPREWFRSDAAFSAYVAGYEEGKRQKKDLDEREAVDTSVRDTV